MPSFTALLIQTCTIEQKTLSTSGYEKVPTWTTRAANVPCRKDSKKVAIAESVNQKINTDDDLFFFNPDASVSRGNRIVLEGTTYDVIDVNKVLDSKGVHHLEVTGRSVDHA